MTQPSAPDEPALFDLPLGPPAPPREPEGEPLRSRRRSARRAAAPALPLFPAEEQAAPAFSLEAAVAEDLGESDAPAQALPEPPPRPHLVARPASPQAAPATLGQRLRATCGDLLIWAAVIALLLVGAERLGAELSLALWPAWALFLAAFSYLYTVIPLAFWGQTPGMVWAGIAAESGAREPLAFGQTTRRWLGLMLTLAAAGLPGLLALGGGRSLADLLSGSRTVAAPTSA